MSHLRRGKAAAERRRWNALDEITNRVKLAGFAGEHDAPVQNPALREARLSRAITERTILEERLRIHP